MISIPAFLGGGDNYPRKPSPKQLQAANQFAKDFATRKGLMIGANAHVGGQLPRFIDSATGQEFMNGGQQFPFNTIRDIRQIPSYVRPEDIVTGKDNLQYFEDQQTGDFIPIHPDIMRSPRFNPNRGQHDKSIAKQ